jgi:hypothetical protein
MPDYIPGNLNRETTRRVNAGRAVHCVNLTPCTQ